MALERPVGVGDEFTLDDNRYRSHGRIWTDGGLLVAASKVSAKGEAANGVTLFTDSVVTEHGENYVDKGK